MYFREFPAILYDAEGTKNPKIVTNLLRRVALRTNVDAQANFYSVYYVEEGETPEAIAFKLYGDVQLHWVILLVNNITDRYHQWPMSTPQFQDYISDKYSDPNGVHHYEITQESGDETIKIDVGTSNTDYSSATAITNFEYEQNLQDTYRSIKLLEPQFVREFVSEWKTLTTESIL
tara:strand:+ start:1380 stop:1907 length:528 start_codon:yes stop_codon:yes gene_type:complete